MWTSMLCGWQTWTKPLTTYQPSVHSLTCWRYDKTLTMYSRWTQTSHLVCCGCWLHLRLVVDWMLPVVRYMIECRRHFSAFFHHSMLLLQLPCCSHCHQLVKRFLAILTCGASAKGHTVSCERWALAAAVTAVAGSIVINTSQTAIRRVSVTQSTCVVHCRERHREPRAWGHSVPLHLYECVFDEDCNVYWWVCWCCSWLEMRRHVRQLTMTLSLHQQQQQPDVKKPWV